MGLVHRAVCLAVYVPAFGGTHCAYPQRNGQAESNWGMKKWNGHISVHHIITNKTQVQI